MINYRKYLSNKRGSMTIYVIAMIAIVLVAVSVMMAMVIRNTSAVKVKDNLTYEESMAVNNIKKTLDDYSGLSVKDKVVEEIEYNGQKYSLEIIPTDEFTTEPVVKEYTVENSKVNSERYYAYDTVHTASETKVTKQDVYNTVSTVSSIDANNDTNNQYLVFGNSAYQKTTVSALPNALKGLINNSTLTVNKVPSNYLNVGRGVIQNISGVERVRVTKENNEYKYVDNYPANLSFPFSIAENAIFLVEYLDKNNDVVKWSRFGPTVNPNTPLTNVFANKAFISTSNDSERRPKSTSASDVSINSIKNSNLFREVPKMYSSLTETLQTLSTPHTTNSIEDYKTTGVSFNYVWDYLKACVSEEVTGYPFTGELQTNKEKMLSDYDGSTCETNQSKVNYDVSLSKNRDNKESYPIYTNWSTLDKNEVEEVFTFYKNNWSELFKCIRNPNATPNHFCESDGEVSSSTKSNYTASQYSRENVKNNFLFCTMEGYDIAVIDSNERWVRFANEMWDEIVAQVPARLDELEREAYEKALADGLTPSDPLTIVEYGEIPEEPTFSFNDEVELNPLLNGQNLLAYVMPLFMSGGFDSGEIIVFTANDVSINIPMVLREIVRKGNYEQKFQTELARADFYKVPCLPQLKTNNKNYKFTIDEVPYVSFNLDIITNVASRVKITTKHKAEVDNARTEYLLNFYNGVELTNIYKETNRNSKQSQYKTFNKTEVVSVIPNYSALDFSDLGKDTDLVSNRLQFQFSSFNRNLEYVKVEYDVIEEMKYEYHIYNSKGQRLYHTSKVKKNSL